MNIREFLENQVKMNPEKVYLYFENEEITYKNFDRQVNKVAAALLNSGVRKGDRFAIMLPNSPEFLYTWFGLNKIGAVEVPVNTGLRPTEVEYILNHSEAKGVVIHLDYLPLLESIRADLGDLKQMILVGEQPAQRTTLFKDWIASASCQVPPISLSEKDPAATIYTSGTTARPKGVLLSHRSFVLTGESYAFMIGGSSEDRIMTPNPLFHINAQVYSTMGSLAAGASLILVKKFSRSRILEQTRRYGATKLVLVQAVTPWVWSRPFQEDDGDNPVTTVIAGNWPTEIYRDFERRFRVKNQTIYSLTETPLGIMGPREGTGARKVGGIGVPMSHPNPMIKNDVKIVNEVGEELLQGERGEIVIRNPATMIGYFKDPGKTAATKRDGWIYTGDIGYRDESGYFFFVARKKETIRRRGELISPLEVESVINSHPKVQESAVIGVPSGLGIGEEEIKAYVLLKAGESAMPEEIIVWCRERLAEFKIPRYLEFRTDFPRSSIGRIQKHVLKAEKENLYPRGAING